MREKCIAENVARLRLDRRLTQEILAHQAGISRLALGRIERGEVVPRARTLVALAKALGTPIGELFRTVRRLESVRFRARAQVHGRAQMLANISKWLDSYCWLEQELGDDQSFAFERVSGSAEDPEEAARVARGAVALDPEAPVRDICGLLERHGVKLLLLDTHRDSFFGLSVASPDGGPAVVVNTWDRISVERWIFTAAHELGHLLLHPFEYQREATELPDETEREADRFAAEFLMPDAAFEKKWHDTRGHSLLARVLKVKRIFRVSYQTVLHRLVTSKRAPTTVWATFQAQHRAAFGGTLRKTDEPQALTKSEFAWNWSRASEPVGLSRHDFMDDRLSRLVRRALEEERISLGRAAEILGMDREQMRRLAGEWAD